MQQNYMSEHAIVGLCTVTLYLHGVASLKGKRRTIKPVLARMRNTYNVSCAEIAQLDKWQSSVIAFTCVSNSHRHIEETIQNILRWMESHFPDVMITDYEIEIL